MKLLRDLVLVKADPEVESKTASGLFTVQLPSQFHKGTVVRVGQYQQQTMAGDFLDSPVKPGDRVVFLKGQGDEFEENHEKYRLIGQNAIVGVLEADDEPTEA